MIRQAIQSAVPAGETETKDHEAFREGYSVGGNGERVIYHGLLPAVGDRSGGWRGGVRCCGRTASSAADWVINRAPCCRVRAALSVESELPVAMRRTMTLVVIVMSVVVLALLARMYFAGHQAPADEPPLADLTSDSLDSLKADFNRSADGVRIIILLSPA
jgi:hypothetical protein